MAFVYSPLGSKIRTCLPCRGGATLGPRLNEGRPWESCWLPAFALQLERHQQAECTVHSAKCTLRGARQTGARVRLRARNERAAVAHSDKWPNNWLLRAARLCTNAPLHHCTCADAPAGRKGKLRRQNVASWLNEEPVCKRPLGRPVESEGDKQQEALSKRERRELSLVYGDKRTDRRQWLRGGCS